MTSNITRSPWSIEAILSVKFLLILRLPKSVQSLTRFTIVGQFYDYTKGYNARLYFLVKLVRTRTIFSDSKKVLQICKHMFALSK